MVKVEVISRGPQICGEGPHWDEASQSLYYVDIPGQNVLRWDERQQREFKIHIKSTPDPSNKIAGFTSLVLPIQGRRDSFVISRGSRLATLQWDGCSQDYSLREFASVDNHVGFPMRFNDGKCDQGGHLWAGTMSEETGPGIPHLGAGSLYSFSSEDGSPTRRQDRISIANGLAFSEDRRSFFYIDTCTMKVEVFDYDFTSKGISNRRTVYDVTGTRTPGLPDGMTIDSRGRLWVALYFGSRVICVDPATGKLLDTVHLPATNITSCTFGGAGMDTLYVTSASVGLADWQLKAQPDAGATFKVTGLGVKGTENVGWKVDYDKLKSL